MTDAANKSYLVMTGRILLALYFLLPGIAKFAFWDMHIGMMQHHNIGMTEPLLAISAIAEIGAALLLLSNRYVRFACLGSALLVIIINIFIHDFWNFEGIEKAHETQNFMKNLGIFAGFLILAGISPKRKLSLGGLRVSDGRIV